MASAGTIKGVALTPGISKNGRLYTKSAIAKAVARAQERIAEGKSPIGMRSHHGAEDDSLRLVGRVDSITLDEDGNARFTASIADTDEGRTILALTDPSDPFLTGVSIRGWWAEDPTVEVAPSGEAVETASDIILDGLDFTASPGVIGARIGESAPVAVGARSIAESIDEVFVEANRKPHGDVSYADPGYQADKVKRYPLDTDKHIRAAWSYVNQADNASKYTAAQLKRIKGRIKAAMKRIGADVSTESTVTEAPVLEFASEPKVGEVTECWGDYGNQVGTAGFSVSLYNGPLTITVSAYSGIEAERLAAIGQAAMAAAVNAVGVLDPDTDGDVDGPMGDEDEAKPDDNNLESAAAAPVKEAAPVAETTDPTPDQAAPEAPTEAPEQPAEDAAAAPEDEPEGGDGEAQESLEDRIVARLLEALQPAAAEGEPAPAVAESAPEGAASGGNEAPAAEPTVEETGPVTEAAVAESVEQIRERVRVEERDRLLEQIRTGAFSLARKGLVPAVAEAGAPEKPLHEMTDEEFRAYKKDVVNVWVP